MKIVENNKEIRYNKYKRGEKMKRIAQSNNLIIFCFMIVIILMTVLLPSYSCATVINPGDYEPNSLQASDVSKVKKSANPIIGALKTAGIVVAVITIAVLGIKYMIAGINERAEYKKTMIPYLVGAILVVAITQLLSVVIQLVTNVK